MTIRLGVEFGAPPIFRSDVDAMGHLSADQLDISEGLAKEIGAWDRSFQITFNSEYPPDSGFTSKADQASHNAHGEELAREIATQLRGKAVVEFAPLT